MPITGSYQYGLVALSVVIAVLASYAALDLAERVTAASGWARWVWLAGGATAMGFGIWSMHYIGMLAYRLPVPVGYDWPTVMVSLGAAILASAVALYVVSHQKMGTAQALTGSVIMGLGIASMHYIGMAAMRLPAMCQYDIRLVALSVLFAVLISLAALWVAFEFRNHTKKAGWRKLGSAIGLGAAIPVLHYTGMAAARFVPTTTPPDLSHAVSISTLGTLVIAAVTIIILGLVSLTSWVDRKFAAHALELHASDERYRHLFERSLAGVYVGTPDGRLLDCNDAYSRILGYASNVECLSYAKLDSGFGSGDREEFLSKLEDTRALTNFEHCLQRKDNTSVWVLENATLFESNDDVAAVVEGTLIDITKRKQAETDLLQANSLLEKRQKEIDQELLLAERVQETLVPKGMAWPAGSVETFYQPARTIGGDFGLVAESPGCLNVMVCDVSGHGIGSALVANRIYTETMGQIQRGSEFAEMLRHLNNFVFRSFGGEFYITLAAARVKWDRRILEFAGAGHPPAMILQPGESPRLLESQSRPLGLMEEAVSGEATIEIPLQAGDRLVIYTDGFSESFNAQEETLGIQGLCEIVREASLLPLPKMKQNILDRVAAWQSGPPADDLSLVVVGFS